MFKLLDDGLMDGWMDGWIDSCSFGGGNALEEGVVARNSFTAGNCDACDKGVVVRSSSSADDVVDMTHCDASDARVAVLHITQGCWRGHLAIPSVVPKHTDECEDHEV